MAPEVIDLLSSDDVSEIPSSSAPAVLETRTCVQSYNDLSDEIDFLPSPKRRRLTPPPPVLSTTTEPPTGSNALASKADPPKPGPSKSRHDHDPIAWNSSPALPVITRQPAARPQDTRTQRASKDAVEELLGQSFSSDASPRVPSTQNLGFSSRTAAILAELDGNRKAKQATASARMRPTVTKMRRRPSRNPQHVHRDGPAHLCPR